MNDSAPRSSTEIRAPAIQLLTAEEAIARFQGSRARRRVREQWQGFTFRTNQAALFVRQLCHSLGL